MTHADVLSDIVMIESGGSVFTHRYVWRAAFMIAMRLMSLSIVSCMLLNIDTIKLGGSVCTQMCA